MLVLHLAQVESLTGDLIPAPCRGQTSRSATLPSGVATSRVEPSASVAVLPPGLAKTRISVKVLDVPLEKEQGEVDGRRSFG